MGGACPGSFADNFAKITFNELTAARFGRVGYFKTYPVPQGDLDAKGELGMVVGFEPATPSNLLVYLPRTNAIVSRGDFKEVKDLTEFKELMSARAKGAPITADAIQTRREFLQSNTSPLLDDGIETVINSIQTAQSANPDFNISDLNVQMKATNAIAIFGDDEVKKGVLKEIDNLISTYSVTQFVTESSIPSKALILDSTDIYKGKTKNGIFTEVKVRVAALGCNQPSNSYGQTSSPTVETTSVNAMLSLAKYYKARISSADVPAAYLQSNLTEEIYMRFSKKMSAIILKARPELSQFTDKKGRLLVKLLKSLYGLKQAGANWFMEIVAAITDAGFIQCKSDPCVFYMHAEDPSGDPTLKRVCFIALHVDDILRICNHPEFARILESALARYGDLRWEHGNIDYLGVHYIQQPDFSIRADMSAMTERILKKHNVVKSSKYPSPHNLFELFDDDQDYSANSSDFLSQVMAINYLIKVRVDIAKEIQYLASLAKNPGPVAYRLLHQVQAYLFGTFDKYILFGTDDPTVNLYVDAAFAVHPRDSTSHGAIYITLGNHTGPLYARSSKIKAVCTSICEAELWKLVDGVQQTYPLAKFLNEIGAIDSIHFVVHEDNEAAIIISYAGEGRTKKSKHFRVRFDFLKQMLDEGTIEIRHCLTKDMTVDVMTKGMVGEPFIKMTTTIMGLDRQGSVTGRTTS